MAPISPHRHRVAVTGASGFIGRALVSHLAQAGHEVLAVSRSEPSAKDIASVVVGDYTDSASLERIFAGYDSVVHLAALAHRGVSAREPDPGAVFAPNVAAATSVAAAAAAARVRRLVLVSSIGVNGNHTDVQPFTEAGPAAPVEPYAVSKWQSETAVRQVVAEHPALEFVIVRPPLVYGPGAPGNFARLVRAIRRGMPLPLGGLANRRSFLGLDNLLGFIELALRHPDARNELYLLSDGEDVSTAEFIHRIGQACRKPARLVHCPLPLLRFLARLGGREEQLDRLASSLQVDSSKARTQLGWKPSLTLDEGLRRAVARSRE
jgi:nucleoside-diphosphate-sugar epimerase